MKKIKIKLQPETILALVAAAAMTIICAVIVGINVLVYKPYARAEGEEAQETIVEVEEKDSLAQVFKESILPYCVSAGTSVVAYLIALAPYIKLKGKYKSLQGVYTETVKVLDLFKNREGEFTAENFIKALETNVIEGLKSYISDTVTQVVKDNFIDNTEALNAIQVTTDTLTAQLSNFTKAALLTWGEKAGVKEILTESPTSQVLEDLYKKYSALKAQFEAKNAEDTAELDAGLKLIEGYRNEN